MTAVEFGVVTSYDGPALCEWVVTFGGCSFSGDSAGGPLVRAGSCPTQAGLLDLSNRNITVVPANAFEGMLSLVKLSLRGNKLSTLPSGVFSNLSSLRSAYF
jgi:hypothetical protein